MNQTNVINQAKWKIVNQFFFSKQGRNFFSLSTLKTALKTVSWQQ
jgi:hypothetical protein